MVRKLLQKFEFYRRIRFFRYVYLNFFCKSVVRTDWSLLIPYKGAVIDIEPGARLILGGGDVEIGCDLMKGSRAETRVRLRKGAVWSNEGGCRIAYGATVEILSGGVLDTQFFTVNTGSVISANSAAHGNIPQIPFTKRGTSGKTTASGAVSILNCTI